MRLNVKIIYRYTFAWQEARGDALASLGAKFEAPKPSSLGGGIGVCCVEEGSQNWLEVSELMRRWDGGALVETEFTKSDIAQARFCAFRVTHVNGYPQPEDDFLYRERTYDTRAYCPVCGIGLSQNAPFSVRRSLKRGRNSFLRLFWVREAAFSLRDAWQQHLAPLGIGCRPVEDVKGVELEDMIQLQCDSKVPLAMSDLERSVCETCGRERFPWHNRGFFPAPARQPNSPIFHSEQYFGAGHASSNEIIVSAEVVKAIQLAGLKGVEFWPCAPSE